jgi:hypothetical protein
MSCESRDSPGSQQEADGGSDGVDDEHETRAPTHHTKRAEGAGNTEDSDGLEVVGEGGRGISVEIFEWFLFGGGRGEGNGEKAQEMNFQRQRQSRQVSEFR